MPGSTVGVVPWGIVSGRQAITFASQVLSRERADELCTRYNLPEMVDFRFVHVMSHSCNCPDLFTDLPTKRRQWGSVHVGERGGKT